MTGYSCMKRQCQIMFAILQLPNLLESSTPPGSDADNGILCVFDGLRICSHCC